MKKDNKQQDSMTIEVQVKINFHLLKNHSNYYDGDIE